MPRDSADAVCVPFTLPSGGLLARYWVDSDAAMSYDVELLRCGICGIAVIYRYMVQHALTHKPVNRCDATATFDYGHINVRAAIACTLPKDHPDWHSAQNGSLRVRWDWS